MKLELWPKLWAGSTDNFITFIFLKAEKREQQDMMTVIYGTQHALDLVIG